MIDIHPTDLRYFLETANTLNISRAAERLDIGQPALSQALRRLELVIGTKLFDRFKTGVQLTPAGKRLAKEGRDRIESWAQLRVAALSAEHEVGGCYLVGCHPSVGVYSLPQILKCLLGKHPHLQVNLVHGLSREILESVVSFRVDFGLVINPVRHPDLVIRKLCEDQVSIWASKDADPTTLICDPALTQTQLLLKKARRSSTFSRYLHTSSLEVIASLAESGCGAAILPSRVAHLHPRLKRLVDSPSIYDTLCLVYRSDRRLSAAGRAIVAAIVSAKI